MADQVADLFVTLRGVNGQFVKSMDEAGAASERADGKIAGLTKGIGTIAIGFAAAAAVVAGYSVKQASEFDRLMELVHTQAGASQAEVEALKGQVLALAPAVGQGPKALADALFHVESVGYRGAAAMLVLTNAAKLASISGANLDDVTYGLTSIMNSYGAKANEAAHYAAFFNAVVGAGDMRMQDFAASVGTGFFAAAQSFGVSLQSAGSALVFLTDRGMRADEASTRLRMSLALMAAPSQKAAKLLTDIGMAGPEVVARTSAMTEALKQAGLSTVTLSEDLKKPDGIFVALSDLKQHLIASGLSASAAAALLSKSFGGGRSDAAIQAMLENLGTLQQKYNAVGHGMATFADSWTQTTKQFSFQVSQLKAQAESWAIDLGNMLIPVLSKLIGYVMNVVNWFGKHKQAAEELGRAVRTFLVGALVTAGVALAVISGHLIAVTALFAGVSFAVGTVAMALVHLYQHNAKFRAFVQGLAADAKKWFGEIVNWFKDNWPKIQQTAQNVIGKIAQGVQRAVQDIKGWWQDHKTQVESTWNSVWTTVQRVGGQIKKTVKDMIDQLKQWWDQHGTEVAQIWNKIFDTIMAAIKAYGPVVVAGFQLMCDFIKLAFRGVLDALAVIVDVMTGHWSQAWHDMKKTAEDNVTTVNAVLNDGGKLASAYAQAVQDLANNLNNVPRNVAINLQVNTHGVPLSAVDQSLGMPHNAGGGTLGRGWSLVGENGPELVYNENSGRSKVFPAGQTSQMQGARGGDTHVHLHGIVGDAQQLIEIAGRELGWHLRINQ